ncbi:uncharacterized protein TrAtP1_010407 [Trichoderma atroviride]|uniref:uncharacterized protein n=1 Tax=Hypocrea atroviridis TaxID=63577 RepID=UPI003328DD15|nr:hypothetical protein TrAtP1_010407 [Trichoderma atroviride]
MIVPLVHWKRSTIVSPKFCNEEDSHRIRRKTDRVILVILVWIIFCRFSINRQWK